MGPEGTENSVSCEMFSNAFQGRMDIECQNKRSYTPLFIFTSPNDSYMNAHITVSKDRNNQCVMNQDQFSNPGLHLIGCLNSIVRALEGLCVDK